jgi:hypothetical protein
MASPFTHIGASIYRNPDAFCYTSWTESLVALRRQFDRSRVCARQPTRVCIKLITFKRIEGSVKKRPRWGRMIDNKQRIRIKLARPKL